MNIILPIILITLFVAIAGYFITKTSRDTWYSGLQQSSLSPPNWLFGVVWPILYFLIAVSVYLTYKAAGTKKAQSEVFLIFIISMAFNLLWTIVFFGLRDIRGALIILLILDVIVIYMIWRYLQIYSLGGMLLIPYLLWILFATYLNYDIMRKNST